MDVFNRFMVQSHEAFQVHAVILDFYAKTAAGTFNWAQL